MTPESSLSNQIRLAIGSKPGVRLFRQNVGTGWTGSKVERNRDGSITIRDPRPLHAGLCKGSADLIGWRSLKVTPDMVGDTVAVFASIEVKGKNARTTVEQLNWLENVLAAGGLAGIVRSVPEAEQTIANL